MKASARIGFQRGKSGVRRITERKNAENVNVVVPFLVQNLIMNIVP
jgi:hypothetical protein